MGELTDSEIDEALPRGAEARALEPRASAARFDVKRRLVVVELSNGCSFSFPPALAQGLEGAGDDELAAVEVLGSGTGLHWEKLDVDLLMPGLLTGLFGTRSHMARVAGRVSSPAKAAAARRNGARGGRPRKAAGA